MMMMMMICFCAWLTDEKHLALFPVESIVRDPPNHETPTHFQQGFNLEIT